MPGSNIWAFKCKALLKNTQLSVVSIIESQSKIDIEISWNTAYSHLSIWSALKKKKKKPSSRVQLAENELKLTTVQSYNRFLTSHPPICRPVTDEDLMLCSFSLVYKNAKAPATKVLCPFASDTSSAWEEAGWGKEGGGVVTREMLSGFVSLPVWNATSILKQEPQRRRD